MCGIAGFLRASTRWDGDPAGVLTSMIGAIAHRGPDDSGIWLDPELGVALGHRRLSIVDLSPNGHQPMVSASGRYVIVYNGEIYNHKQLRAELDRAQEGAPRFSWRGHSDTEVMLACFERWGVEAGLQRLNGMFAFALCDRRERVLHLARDRFGEKPLYYGWMGDSLLFGSELKALKKHSDWSGEIDRSSVAVYLRHAYVPAPYSIYRGIHKLPPAHVLSIPLSGAAREIPPSRAYWSAKDLAERALARPFTGTPAEGVATLDGLLREAVALRMEADVPLGAFLSGGIDSSLVVALMQAQAQRPVKTFTIGFREEAYNEAEHARAVARHLGTDHTELYVSEDEAMSVIPQLPRIYDEPFADASQLPTFLVARMTRQHVTVALSGDGGDELFGGYSRYLWGRYIWRQIGWMQTSVRSVLARLLLRFPTHTWDRILTTLNPAMPRRLRARLPGDKLHKLAGVLASVSPDAMYQGLVTFWDPKTVALEPTEPPTALTDRTRWAALPDFVERMLFLDLISYLPDDILAKVDRASMAVSLETRIPMLDPNVAEFAWALRSQLKMRDGQGKWPLRQLLRNYVPQKLIDRPKMGFGVPIDSWLRGRLREWAEGLLSESRLRSRGYLDVAAVRRKWDEHLSGQRNWQYQLWIVLMLEAWLEAQD